MEKWRTLQAMSLAIPEEGHMTFDRPISLQLSSLANQIVILNNRIKESLNSIDWFCKAESQQSRSSILVEKNFSKT